MTVSATLSDILQAESLNLGSAVSLIQATIDIITAIMSEDELLPLLMHYNIPSDRLDTKMLALKKLQCQKLHNTSWRPTAIFQPSYNVSSSWRSFPHPLTVHYITYDIWYLNMLNAVSSYFLKLIYIFGQ